MNKITAIVGGGAAGIYVLREMLKDKTTFPMIRIYEAAEKVGPGMPYSPEWVDEAHMANVTLEEIPPLMQSAQEWIEEQGDDWFNRHNLNRADVTKEYTPSRIVLGEYLADQYPKMLSFAERQGIKVETILATRVDDIIPKDKKYTLKTGETETTVDRVVVAIGHVWPKRKEQQVSGYFDSPFPSQKLHQQFDHEVGIKGSSLTAVDAVKTLAYKHGRFSSNNGVLQYIPNEGTENFRMTLHSRRGLLPGIRAEYENDNPKMFWAKTFSLQKQQISQMPTSLDGLFEKLFKEPLRDQDPEFSKKIETVSLEEFVAQQIKQQKSRPAFESFEAELKQAQRNAEKKAPIYWQQHLDNFAYLVNYRAKHLSAEDNLRLKETLFPFVAQVTASLPFGVAEELLALHKAGKLDIVAVGEESVITTNPDRSGAAYQYVDATGINQEKQFQTFIDCTGQRAIPLEQFPFPTLLATGTVCPATAKFASEAAMAAQSKSEPHQPKSEIKDGHLVLSGLAINDNFQPINKDGKAEQNLAVIAAPYISGHNPDPPGLYFCRDVARTICGSFKSIHR